jgi:hypothetical protein
MGKKFLIRHPHRLDRWLLPDILLNRSWLAYLSSYRTVCIRRLRRVQVGLGRDRDLLEDASMGFDGMASVLIRGG